MSDSPKTSAQEQEEFLHLHRLISDLNYAEWQEEFRCYWRHQEFYPSGDIPHSFIIQMFDAGFDHEVAFELFKIADAESYARKCEYTETQYLLAEQRMEMHACHEIGKIYREAAQTMQDAQETLERGEAL